LWMSRDCPQAGLFDTANVGIEPPRSGRLE
jgi:hypothetical protein